MTSASYFIDQLLEKLAKTQTIYILDDYDPSYDFLRTTWKHFATRFNTTPQKIILLETMVFEDRVPRECVDELIEVCNRLTEEGYCVRDISKYQPCETKCGNAIVTRELYNHAKNKWKFLPEKWSRKCSVCTETS